MNHRDLMGRKSHCPSINNYCNKVSITTVGFRRQYKWIYTTCLKLPSLMKASTFQNQNTKFDLPYPGSYLFLKPFIAVHKEINLIELTTVNEVFLFVRCNPSPQHKNKHWLGGGHTVVLMQPILSSISTWTLKLIHYVFTGNIFLK